MAYLKLARRLSLVEQSYRLQLWVAEASNGIPAEIFVYQRMPCMPGDVNQPRRFVHVASYSDLLTFPALRPTADLPYFRLAGMDMLFDGLSDAENAWTVGKGHVFGLVREAVKLGMVAGPVQVVEVLL